MHRIYCLASTLLLAAPALVAQFQNVILGVGYTSPSGLFTVGPGQLVTLFVPDLNVPDAAASQTPLPASLSGVSVAVTPLNSSRTENYPKSLPILRVYTERACRSNNPPTCPNTQITVQIPTEKVCGVPVENSCELDHPPELVLSVRANGVAGPDLRVQNAGGGKLLSSCDAIFGKPGDCYPLITHADGTLVSGSSPARVGEIITVYAVGGPVTDENRAPSGYPLLQNVPIPSPAHLFFRYQIYNAGIASYLAVEQPVGTTYYGQVGGYIGLYQINLAVPPMPAGTYQCSGSDKNASVGDTLYFCVKP